MVLHKSEVRQEILNRLCEKCGEGYAKEEDFILTFYRGQFITLHERCSGFIDNPQSNKRVNLTP